jgi:GntR family transcriptional repressor for pyruvate dehydrogenase complex
VPSRKPAVRKFLPKPAVKPSAKPRRGVTTARRVVDALQDLIRRERVRPGERLPTEHELARRFHASRPIVREAITTLKALGVVESRPKVGLRLLAFDPACLFDCLGPRIETQDEVEDLYELRCLLEPRMLALVARRATASDYERLEAMLASAASSAGEDLSFHEALWHLAGNRFVWGMRGLLLRFFGERPAQPGGAMPSARWMHEDHRSIVRALRAGDLEEATRVMGAHLAMRPAGRRVV